MRDDARLAEIYLSDYGFRVWSSLLSSEVVPASVRTTLMRWSGFHLHKKSTLWAGANLRSRKLSMGAEVFVNVGFYHDGYDFLTIGDRVRIGPYVKMITATHEIGPAYQRGLVEVVGKPITIEDGCWIGSAVTVMPGVVVAAGCVLAAGAVLYESTEPNGLYAGSPARRVRDLDF